MKVQPLAILKAIQMENWKGNSLEQTMLEKVMAFLLESRLDC